MKFLYFLYIHLLRKEKIFKYKGKSSFETVDVIESYGAKVNALTSIVNRSGKKEINGLKLLSATELNIETYDPDNLPEDLKDTPAVKPGSRK